MILKLYNLNLHHCAQLLNQREYILFMQIQSQFVADLEARLYNTHTHSPKLVFIQLMCVYINLIIAKDSRTLNLEFVKLL